MGIFHPNFELEDYRVKIMIMTVINNLVRSTVTYETPRVISIAQIILDNYESC